MFYTPFLVAIISYYNSELLLLQYSAGVKQNNQPSPKSPLYVVCFRFPNRWGLALFYPHDSNVGVYPKSGDQFGEFRLVSKVESDLDDLDKLIF